MANPDSGQADPFRAALRFILARWRREGMTAPLCVALMLAAVLCDVAMPLLAGRLTDAVSTGAPDAFGRSMWLLAGMVALGAGMAALRYGGIRAVIRLTLGNMTGLAHDTFARVQRLSADWHAETFAGSTVRKISRGMWAIDLLNDTVLIALLPSFVVLVAAAGMLATLSPWLGLVVLLGAFAHIGLTAGLSILWVAPASRLSNRWDSRLGGALSDSIGANAVVKSFAAEPREDALLGGLLRRWRQRTERAWLRGTAANAAQDAMLLLLRGAVIGAALLLWHLGHATPGDVVAALTMYLVVQGYLRDVGYHISNLQRSVNELEDAVALEATRPAIADAPGAAPLRATEGAIRFEHVGFRYGGHVTPLYRDLDIRIAGGERIGLVGHSGSGKSTLVKLLQRLHDPTEGRITIDGRDIAGVTQASLRRSIAVVAQEPVLFHRSIAENIAYGRPGASEAEILRAASLAHADGFIARLPRGMHTLVGERGVKLSGGERQRIALARAFLADAPILVLDEATAALDSESEAMIQDAMERLLKGRTALVIAHRLSTVRAMDRILVFDRGRVAEEGSHAALLARPEGIYAGLFRRQAEGLADVV
ncbi:ABC transporter ATP-binding protein [Roseomonas terrae]|jgi:ATP-binding cassette subfamily B protein|uniref:ABC transporter ATP-binding protein n=1 Tax=Neoroseomonas terrae TaxID=424799 RepID=A0ABS5ED62_9PROT|nr:ABC transporter ATP-binding protein [Neoroseomonas terrae]MBR0648963.1 ABC transporter ATP-binding protein [Neoroseomonas terrae]